MLRRYGGGEIELFLQAVDRQLDRPCRVVLLGGAVLGLRYSPEHATSDIDVWTEDKELWEACEAARRSSGLSIPVQRAAIATPPDSFEERLEPLPVAGASKLQVFVPEVHDLTLSKIARGETHDLQAVEDLHRKQPLSLETLLQRFEETHVIGSREMFKLAFLDAVERLFGHEQALSVERMLK